MKKYLTSFTPTWILPDWGIFPKLRKLNIENRSNNVLKSCSNFIEWSNLLRFPKMTQFCWSTPYINIARYTLNTSSPFTLVLKWYINSSCTFTSYFTCLPLLFLLLPYILYVFVLFFFYLNRVQGVYSMPFCFFLCKSKTRR